MSAGGVPAPRGAAGALAASLDLIHRNKVPTPVSMRVAARFDDPSGLPVQFLKAPCPLSFLMGWRAANGAKSRT
mgnify:CR=1 FL=1